MTQLTQLNSSFIIKDNMNKDLLFFSAIKVFVYSYYGWDEISDADKQIYDQCLKSYFAEMQRIFDKQYDFNQTVKQISDELSKEEFVFQCGVLRITGLSATHRAEIHVYTGITSQREHVINLSQSTTTQILTLNISPMDLKNNRTDKKTIRMQFYENGRHAHQDFTIQYHEIHPEGFTGWHEFSKTSADIPGIRALIKIKFSLVENRKDEYHLNAELIHNHLLCSIVQYRLTELRKKHSIANKPHEQYVANRKKSSILVERVRPDRQEEAFWPKPFSEAPFSGNTTPEQFDPIQYLREHHPKSNFRYTDLDISAPFGDYEFWSELPNNAYCVCNEWCNWSAFYDYNPILRFLMIQHNNLYLKNNTKLPEIYLFMTCYFLDKASQQPLHAPLFHLMRSAFNYCYKCNDLSLFDTSFLNLRQSVTTFSPKSTVSAAISYKILRSQFTLAKTPFIAGSVWTMANIEDVETFYEVLIYLHNRLNGDRDIVPANKLDKWHEELDVIAKIFYYKVLIVMLNDNERKHIGEVDLFSNEYKIENLISMNENEQNVIRERQQSIISSLNEFNEKFICSAEFMQMVNTAEYMTRIAVFADVNKGSHNYQKNEQIFIGQLDDAFKRIVGNIMNDTLKLKPASLHANRTPNLEMNTVYMYFTLKSYAILLFTFQRHMIMGFCKFNRKQQTVERVATRRLFFVFTNDWIELIIKRFTIDDNNGVYKHDMREIVTPVEELYGFWGNGRHEHQNLFASERFSSLIHEYGRLYHWWKNDGNNARNFRKIFISAERCAEYVCDRTDHLFATYIVNRLAQFMPLTDKRIDLIDIVMQWLVRASCAMLIRISAYLLKPMHDLENKLLIKNNHAFMFCKPGFVPVIRFHTTLIGYVERVKNKYIEFDDEFNRIDTALSDTKAMIKSMYRDYWKYLITIWCKEMNQFFTIPVSNQLNALIVHTIVGMSVIYPFVSDFRRESYRYRKHLWNEAQKMQRTNLGVVTKNYKSEFYSVLNQFRTQWAKRSDEMKRAMPLASHVWQNYLSDIILIYDGMDATDKPDIKIANQ